MRRLGFTLAELLIALAILAVIAMFAIPKVLQAQQEARKIAVLKEAIAELTAVYEQGRILGEIHNAQTCTAYPRQAMNHTRFCDMGNINECWPASGPTVDTGALVLHSGVVIADFDCAQDTQGPGTLVATINIDWNGVEGPNVSGEDQLVYFYNFGPNTTSVSWVGIRPGTADVRPEALRDRIFR